MAPIKSRKHTQSRINQHMSAALAIMLLPVAAHAADAPAAPAKAPAKTAQTLPEVTVSGQADAPYKVEKVSSPKLTQPLVDTPQTISVIRKELIMEQGATSIMEALRNTPGITLQLGENGNTSAGDTFQMRGFATQSSVFVDGVRDLGAVSRDAFNIEQIEVSKGPAGADIGRGAASGYVNLVSKMPALDQYNSASAGLDSAGSKRVTADLNHQLSATSAVRLNLMAQDGDVVGRDHAKSERQAIAPSLAFGLGTPTRIFLSSQHMRQDNVPDGGIPTVGLQGFYHATPALAVAPRVERENYYGLAGDYEKVDADMATVKIEHDLAPGSKLTNISRYGKSKMDRIMTGVNAIVTTSADRSAWTVARTRQSLLQENEILANQTNLVTEFATGSVKHTLSSGVEFMTEKQSTPVRAGLGTVNNANLYNPNVNDAVTGLNPQKTGAFTKGSTSTAALYAFDTLKLSEQWQVNAGLRLEHYNTETNSAVVSTKESHPALPVGTLVPTSLEKSDNLISWKAGALYKPADNASVYLALSNSQTPPGGANFALSGAVGNVNGPSMAPQQTRNIELGTKWDVLAKQLALTAALYRTENKNEFPVLDAASGTYSQAGERRVSGIELGAVGQITRAWNVTAGVATMNTKLVEGGTSTSAVNNNATGAASRWSPKLTATIWSSYNVNNNLTVGGGGRYTSEQKRVVDPNVDVATQNNLPSIPSYFVADAMLSYKASKSVTVQLNVYNLFDKFYVSTLNNSGARASLGGERSAALSANVVF